MKIHIFAASTIIYLAGCSPQPSAKNWGECILNAMPGAQNDIAAGTIIKSCSEQFGSPEGKVMRPSNTGEYPSGDQCVIDKAKGTSSELGARVITAACHKLFDKPDGFVDPYSQSQ